jgi:hypothetical protein
VSLIRTGRSAREKASIGDRARGAAAVAIPQARRAGTTAVHGVKQGVDGARGWAAPRLEDAADALTANVAPRISSALRSTARQVRPAPAGKTGLRRLLSWRWLLGIGTALAAAGATAAFTMRKRYQNATEDAQDAATASPGEPAATPTAADEDVMGPQVNGRVTTSRR